VIASFCSSLITIFRTTFSKRLPVVDNRLIGRRFWGHLEFLPAFGKDIVFASFQGLGK
jgi:hypothetical protein